MCDSGTKELKKLLGSSHIQVQSSPSSRQQFLRRYLAYYQELEPIKKISQNICLTGTPKREFQGFHYTKPTNIRGYNDFQLYPITVCQLKMY